MAIKFSVLGKEADMDMPLQITFRNLPPSLIVKAWIGAEAAKLQEFYYRPLACRVAVEVPHRHHKNGRPFHIRLGLSLSGGELIVGRQRNVHKRLWQAGESKVRKQLELEREHKNLHPAIHDAFKAAGRALKEYARRQRGDVKTHRFHLERMREALGLKLSSIA
jgi:hypothetical protein